VEVSHDLARRVDLDGGLRADVAVDQAAPDDDRGHVDLGVHLRPFADDEGVVAPDLALEHSVDTNAPLEVELPFELRSSTEEGRDLGGGQLLVHAGGPTRRRAGQASWALRK
jgi:hypothetical protein